MHTALPSVCHLGSHGGINVVSNDANLMTLLQNTGTEHRWPYDGWEFKVRADKYATWCFSSEKESLISQVRLNP